MSCWLILSGMCVCISIDRSGIAKLIFVLLATPHDTNPTKTSNRWWPSSFASRATTSRWPSRFSWGSAAAAGWGRWYVRPHTCGCTGSVAVVVVEKEREKGGSQQQRVCRRTYLHTHPTKSHLSTHTHTVGRRHAPPQALLRRFGPAPQPARPEAARAFRG